MPEPAPVKLGPALADHSEYLDDLAALGAAEARSWADLATRARLLAAEQVGRALDTDPLTVQIMGILGTAQAIEACTHRQVDPELLRHVLDELVSIRRLLEQAMTFRTVMIPSIEGDPR